MQVESTSKPTLTVDEANEGTISAFDQLMNEYSQQDKLASSNEALDSNIVKNEFDFLDSFTNAELQKIEEMERVALKNKSRFSCIKNLRGQTKAWIKAGRIQKGHSRLREWFIHQRKEFERKQAEIREREEETKRKTEEFRERERRYSEKLRNGTPEERERERVFNRKKRGMEDVTDIMERRRWGFESL